MFPLIFGTLKSLSSFATNGRIMCCTVKSNKKDNFITKKMPRMPTRDTQFPVKSKLVWPYSLSYLSHQIENACSHLLLDCLHDISHFLLGLELTFINTTTGLLFKQHSLYVGQASHQILKSLEKDLKSEDCLFCSTPHNINQSPPLLINTNHPSPQIITWAGLRT